ncbi:MAG: L,D-transpeptidase family protein [Gemmatimonadetes bacterium]|nr:L,D-transpeptidase family protein [Gemmatimonadota bacterium]
MSIRIAGGALIAAALALGCADQSEEDRTIPLGEAPDTTGAVVYWPEEAELTAEEIERGRLDMSWRRAVAREGPADTAPSGLPLERGITPPDSAELAPRPPAERSAMAGPAAPVRVRADTIELPETYQDLESLAGATADTTLPAVQLPLGGDVQGPSVLYVQVLLDRSPFSPGILDGKWGKNTEKAVYWLQRREGIDPTGTVDSTTFQRLYALAERPDRYVRTVTLTEDDVSGPFQALPGDVYARAKLDCLCYESALEKVAERYHSAPDLLQRLNPRIDLSALRAGDSLKVPNVEKSELSHERSALAAANRSVEGSPEARRRGARDTMPDSGPTGRADPAAPGEIARIVISGEGFYLHAVDSDGRIVYHFPATLGAEYAPSPAGDFQVSSIGFAPWFHYQPDLLTGEDPSKPDARLPPGPNSPVGLVWMQLSKPHYGIHGTSAPATIGYVTSHGCVRLTNWDAVFLASRVAPGLPVQFRDVPGRPAEVALRPVYR